MTEAQKEKIDEEIIRKTIWADILEYNVPLEEVIKGMEMFYDLTAERGILPRVKKIDII